MSYTPNAHIGILWRRLDRIQLASVDRMAQEGEGCGVTDFFLVETPEVSLMLAQRIFATTRQARVHLVIGMDYLHSRGRSWEPAVGALIREYPSRLGLALRSDASHLRYEEIREILSKLRSLLRRDALVTQHEEVPLWAEAYEHMSMAKSLNMPVVLDLSLRMEGSNGLASIDDVEVVGVVVSASGDAAQPHSYQRHSGLGDLEASWRIRLIELGLQPEGRDAPLPIYALELDGSPQPAGFLRWLSEVPSASPTLGAQRLMRLTPNFLKADQMDIYLRIRYGPRGQGTQVFRLLGDDEALEGPFNAWLLSPPVGSALEHFGDAMRFACTIAPRWREIAILTVGTYWGSSYERYAHEAVARQVGLSDEEIRMIRLGRELQLMDDKETLVAQLSWAMLEHRGTVEDELYLLAKSLLGEVALFEITVLVGYYSMLALQLEVFRVSVPLVSRDA